MPGDRGEAAMRGGNGAEHCEDQEDDHKLAPLRREASSSESHQLHLDTSTEQK
jgi:hypothetical protein